MNILKFRKDDEDSRYGILEGKEVRPILNAGNISGIFDALQEGDVNYGEAIPLERVRLLPPTDENVSVYCAGLNYSDHAEEVRMPLPASPLFFCKGYGSVTGPVDDIVYPDGVSLLDYEIELAAVIGRRIEKEKATEENIHRFILGVTLLNDISARDVQLRSGQWFLGKSYRTFAPLGPFISPVTEDNRNSLYRLEMELQVWDREGNLYPHKFQRGNTGNMVFRIHDLINSLTRRFPLNPGDIIATGTPRGVALSRPGRFRSRLAEILGIPMEKRTAAFIEREIKYNRKYLERGDTLHARIFSEDGGIDTGEQVNRIV